MYVIITPVTTTSPAKEEIVCVMANGSTRTVPHPVDRLAAIQHAHELGGHFGIKGTMHAPIIADVLMVG